MAWPKGKPNPHGGREKGVPNKLTASIKEAFEAAFADLQTKQDVNLKEWAKANPTEFYKLSTKLLPNVISAAVSFENHLTIK